MSDPRSKKIWFLLALLCVNIIIMISNYRQAAAIEVNQNLESSSSSNKVIKKNQKERIKN